MIFRQAQIEDIPQIQFVRNSVRENVLSDPALVSDSDCQEYITERGRGWVCIVDSKVVGFAIADLKEKNIWALFMHPEHEKKGAAKKLHDIMLDWYFSQTQDTVWLSTAPDTRADTFYRKAGWTEAGIHGNGETKFEMSWKNWRELHS
jgi:GNAT superfamily N-acetyltransferase